MDFKLVLMISTVVTSTLLSGCGGSSGSKVSTLSYDGLSTPVVIDVDSQATISSSTELVTNDLMSLGVINVSDIPSPSYNVEVDGCNGSVSTSGADTTYSNFCINNVIVNGSLETSLLNTSSLVTYSNFRITDGAEEYLLSGSIEEDRSGSNKRSRTIRLVIENDGETVDFNATEVCSIETDGTGSTGSITLLGSCNVTHIFTNDNSNFKIENYLVDEGANEDWDISGTLYIPASGYLDYSATGLVRCSTDGTKFESGVIALEDDANNMLDITITGCDTEAVSIFTAAVDE